MDLDKEEPIPEEERIPAPLDAAYNSFNKAYSALRQHSIYYSYGFRIESSRPYSSRVKTRIYYTYNKTRKYNTQA
jgi:hypothetical protein